ncbi:30S ribosomal protein S6 [Pelobacter propionicus]|uniref:Small ribosomal subunit protein bS6 n=1 Tax=Pelobacter propionicus (strain DSM 2379 / NBRC 103807 / OttBd1) TaxID=338966 RepID=RS6_PELPD|nr:30S ribosomal protein S6 [Pelobacter propionicus]A1AM18.1 RecName: Full=Small ribosomal subunit protein bS6; AltName: Full=30S ribosomal protein S6 [Pelobacter propionicus DSM 2379]ABK98388.1 SSU ribosomal protein S6P [Pelobacter propionicus DSM 2379]
MRKYETIYILQPDLSEDDIKVVADKVQDVITSYKGDFQRLEDWGIRKLAYPINKCARGRYLYLRYDGGREMIAELERRLRLDEKVLRFQSVNITNQPEKPVVEKKPVPVEAEAVESAEAVAAPAETVSE